MKYKFKQALHQFYDTDSVEDDLKGLYKLMINLKGYVCKNICISYEIFPTCKHSMAFSQVINIQWHL